MDDNVLKAVILRKMLMHRWIGGKHTSIDNLPKGFPMQVRKDVSRIVQDLIREGFVVRKPTSYGEHVYLNPNKVHEAKKIAGMV
ncbi:MAG: hypothetical protein HY364_04780 [Candidatus Aenigmarchaeota archaeon]|nr:hypothetical protein [Candidatus Aenigmarchaeota archaeon]